MPVRRRVAPLSREQLSGILLGISDALTVQDPSGELIFANEAAAELIGYPSPEALLDVPLPEIRRRFEILDERGGTLDLSYLPSQRALQGEHIPETRLRFRFADTGVERWSAVSSSPVFDERGNVQYVVNVFRDVTTQKEIEEARGRLAFLAEASNVLASSLDYEATLVSVARLAVPHIGDWCAVHIVEEDGTVHQLAAAHVDPAKVELARQLEERLPYDPHAPAGVPQVLRTRRAELIPEIPDELLAEAISDPEILAITRDLGLKSSMVVPMMARERILGAITFVSAESGRRYGPDDLSLAEDLAGRAALAVDNARLYRQSVHTAAEQAAILEHMASGVVIADPAGHITFINRAGRQLLQMAADGNTIDTLRENVASSTPSGEPALLSRALDGEVVVNVDRVVRRPDGTEIHTQWSAAPVVTDEGVQVGAVGVFRDVTAERELERQKDAFLSAAAHDLKTPLTSMKGVAQLLHRRASRAPTLESGPILRGLEQIDAAATRMGRLVNELLDVSRVQMGRPIELNLSQADLVEVVRRVAAEFRRGTDKHRFLVQADARELRGMWDVDRLERVFANLLSNAVKYSPSGGDITVSVGAEKRDGVLYAVVAVEDHGMGIPAAEVPLIFERFYRASNVEGQIQGTGIGLAGVQQILEQHGGRISVESEIGKGSIFKVEIPVVGEVAAPQPGVEGSA